MKLKTVFLVVSVVLLVLVVGVALASTGPAGKGLYRLVGVVGQVISIIRTSYVEEVQIGRVELGALAGMVESVDPGGAYVPEVDAAGFDRVRSRRLPPYGLALGKRSSYPFVLQAVAGSPAEAAGLLPGELVERVNGEPVRARPVWRAMVLLDEAERAGRDATLVVIDRQFSGTRTVTLKVGKVQSPGPTVEMRDAVPVVRVGEVSKDAVTALNSLLGPHTGAPAAVVDLRSLALGSLDVAPMLAATLAGGDVETKLVRREGDGRVLRGRGDTRSWRLVVCMDMTTAGAAEVVASILKTRGATLIGFETYGDTGVRRAHRGAEGQVWLADEWLPAPDGKPMLGHGLAPDEVVRMRAGADPVLDRALELARGPVQKQAA
ncbi:MAG: PDZ domain-containing protein [Thermoanaerobaculaceae bacterium]|nr:PDZ domain-containing protein [Thermoanaerobaculaceae bacterium]